MLLTTDFHPHPFLSSSSFSSFSSSFFTTLFHSTFDPTSPIILYISFLRSLCFPSCSSSLSVFTTCVLSHLLPSSLDPFYGVPFPPALHNPMSFHSFPSFFATSHFPVIHLVILLGPFSSTHPPHCCLHVLFIPFILLMLFVILILDSFSPDQSSWTDLTAAFHPTHSHHYLQPLFHFIPSFLQPHSTHPPCHYLQHFFTPFSPPHHSLHFSIPPFLITNSQSHFLSHLSSSVLSPSSSL